ncbi:riboflavin kinase, partial [Enterobacter hormaechei]|uniref:riboflavin kinase n=1 Tax=Enterobacter hormaechei TaxID=158836 RepID=UPI0023E79735
LGLGEKPLPGVANIGTRPTVAGIRQQLEVHLLDVAMDLYGRHIQVVLRKKIRNELGLGEKPLPGVANIGTRPTVAGIRQQLEVHLL